jgi:hypothetical protein
MAASRTLRRVLAAAVVRDDQTVVLGLVTTKRSDMESADELKRHGRHLQSSTSPGRFPELGRTFYEQGPGRTIAALATVFERLADRGVLQPDDPLLAAAHFNWLVMSSPLNRAMLLGEDEPPPPPNSTSTRTPECAPSSPPTRNPDRAPGAKPGVTATSCPAPGMDDVHNSSDGAG